MEILDRGYRFYTRHNDAGNVANVEAFFERFQEQAPIKRNQPFELEFYGKGAGIRLGVTAMPRRQPPEMMAADRRERVSRAIADVREAGAVLESIVPSAGTGGGRPPTVVMRAVNPDFHSPFDEKLYDWGLPPPVFPVPTPQPPGGGGGGTHHSAVRIELFLYGGTEPSPDHRRAADWADQRPQRRLQPHRQARRAHRLRLPQPRQPTSPSTVGLHPPITASRTQPGPTPLLTAKSRQTKSASSVQNCVLSIGSLLYKPRRNSPAGGQLQCGVVVDASADLVSALSALEDDAHRIDTRFPEVGAHADETGAGQGRRSRHRSETDSN
ncbi:hypothetical protein A4X20_06110 [Mycolicibacterium iranicum]|uniref:Uncharacterized protein n=1 Tax=Mycolicibacterium iranicum TaxID=912594 RepID=A0A178LTK7_MYCIR|nr:hypothetical protein A4X20_06110 [Mycolicibacterium iranicum]